MRAKKPKKSYSQAWYAKLTPAKRKKVLAKKKEWVKNNPEKYALMREKWLADNPNYYNNYYKEHKRVWTKEYYEENKARLIANQKRYNKKKKEERNAYAAKYRAKNKEKLRKESIKKSSKYYLENREVILKKAKEKRLNKKVELKKLKCAIRRIQIRKED